MGEGADVARVHGGPDVGRAQSPGTVRSWAWVPWGPILAVHSASLTLILE